MLNICKSTLIKDKQTNKQKGMRIIFFIEFLLTSAISPNINFTQIYRVRPTAGSLEQFTKSKKLI